MPSLPAPPSRLFPARLLPAALMAVLLAGCGAPSLDPATPRLLSPAEIQAQVQAGAEQRPAATPARATPETRAATLRARAAALRRMPDPASADPELQRRADELRAASL